MLTPLDSRIQGTCSSAYPLSHEFLLDEVRKCIDPMLQASHILEAAHQLHLEHPQNARSCSPLTRAFL